MRLLDALTRTEPTGDTLTRHDMMTFQQWVDWFSFQGQRYKLSGTPPNMPEAMFSDYVRRIHERTPIISSAAVSRALLVSQLRFMFQGNAANRTPGRMFGGRQLRRLERPQTMKRSSLLFGSEIDVSYSGNAYVLDQGESLTKLRPDWVTVALGSDSAPVEDENGELMPPSDAQIVGYGYQPRAAGRVGRTEFFLPSEIVHIAPEPHPFHWWKGGSWVTAVLDEFTVDQQVTQHQSKYFENAATPNLVVTMDPTKTPDEVKAFAKIFNDRHAGSTNSWRNMFLGGGSDVKVVGSQLDNLALRDLTGGFETRVAVRSMVPPPILSIREGMEGSPLNSSTYGQTRRKWADVWFQPHADHYAEAFEAILDVPPDADLSWDRRRVLFLQEDEKDAADIGFVRAQSIRQLVEAGFEPDAAIKAVRDGDLGALSGQHSGLFSVQLQQAGSGETMGDNAP